MTNSNRLTGFSNAGGFTRSRYDRCAYQKDLYQSVEPLGFQMYPGKYENCSKCTFDETQFWRPFDGQIVDAESELTNRTRRYTRCPQYKYLPGCKKSCYCTNTFDNSVPKVAPQEICSILSNNLPRVQGVGYSLQVEPMCEMRIPRNPVPRGAPAQRVVLVKKGGQ
jgi:hypothetical protein